MKIDDAMRIRLVRTLLGLKTYQLAGLLGVSSNTVSRLENGVNIPAQLTREALARICAANGIGFTPTGYPMPMADILTFKKEES